MTETMKMDRAESNSEKIERKTNTSLEGLRNEVQPGTTDKQHEEYHEMEAQRKEAFLMNLSYAMNPDIEVREYAIRNIKNLFLNNRGMIKFKEKSYDITTDLELFIKAVGSVNEIKKLKIIDYKTVAKLIDDGGGGVYTPLFTRIKIE